MTRNRDFKTLVRQRMDKTGERYSSARTHILDQRQIPGSNPGDGLLPTVVSVGGQQPDVAAARNLCAGAGVVGPDGNALTEAMAFGLAG